MLKWAHMDNPMDNPMVTRWVGSGVGSTDPLGPWVRVMGRVYLPIRGYCDVYFFLCSSALPLPLPVSVYTTLLFPLSPSPSLFLLHYRHPISMLSRSPRAIQSSRIGFRRSPSLLNRFTIHTTTANRAAPLNRALVTSHPSSADSIALSSRLASISWHFSPPKPEIVHYGTRRDETI
jgi:hypothetical protein